MMPMVVAQVGGPSALAYKLTVRPMPRYGTCSVSLVSPASIKVTKPS